MIYDNIVYTQLITCFEQTIDREENGIDSHEWKSKCMKMERPGYRNTSEADVRTCSKPPCDNVWLLDWIK